MPASAGYFSSKSWRAWETSFEFRTTWLWAVAWIPFVSRQSWVYSSIANATIGFCSMFVAVPVSGRVQT